MIYMKEEYLKIRAESLNAPKPEIKISDEDFLRKIFEYVEALFLVFKKTTKNHKKLNKKDPIVIIKKKYFRPKNITEKFIEWLMPRINMTFEADELSKFIIDMRGFNGLPKIVSDEEASVIEQNGITLYRGSDKNDYYANLLAEKSNYHYGHGGYGDGIYASDTKSATEEYTTLNKNKEPLKFYLLGDNGVDYNFLRCTLDCINYKKEDKLVEMFCNLSEDRQKKISLLYDAYHKLPKSIKKYVYESGGRKLGLMAIFLGYDYIVTSDYFITCILNRGSMIVSQSEYNRVVKGTKYETQTTEQQEK